VVGKSKIVIRAQQEGASTAQIHPAVGGAAHGAQVTQQATVLEQPKSLGGNVFDRHTVPLW
jgi:hypothetical protein